MIKGTMTYAPDGSVQFSFNSAVTLLPGQRYNITLELAPNMQELRALRLYHWERVCKLADKICDRRVSRHTLEDHKRQHAEHMRAVQALNDLFPIGDTAERDMERQLASVRLR